MYIAKMPNDQVQVAWWKDDVQGRWNMKMMDLKTEKKTSTWLSVESPHVAEAFQYMYKQCLEELSP